jgi:hypothetical protein
MKEKRFKKRPQKEMTVCKRFLYNHTEDEHRAVSEKLELASLAKERQSHKMFKGNTV